MPLLCRCADDGLPLRTELIYPKSRNWSRQRVTSRIRTSNYLLILNNNNKTNNKKINDDAL